MDFQIKGPRMPQILMLCGVLFLVSGNRISNVWGAPAAAAPEDFKEIQIGPHPGEKELLLLRGPDSRQQVVVTGVLRNGKLQDLTRDVTYTVAHQDIASISNDGYLTPHKDGQTKLTVTAKNGKTASIPVTIQGIATPEAINFKNQVVPIFTKLTCNSGGCHGKPADRMVLNCRCLVFILKMIMNFLSKKAVAVDCFLLRLQKAFC